MKFLVLPLVAMMALPAFAGTLNAAETNQKCLEILIKNAGTIALEGDVRSDETLAGILASAIGTSGTTIKNNCIKNTGDGIYECGLSIQTKVGNMTADTDIAYEVGVGKDGDTPTSMLIQRVYVARGI